MAVEDDSCDVKYEKRHEVVASEKKVQDECLNCDCSEYYEIKDNGISDDVVAFRNNFLADGTCGHISGHILKLTGGGGSERWNEAEDYSTTYASQSTSVSFDIYVKNVRSLTTDARLEELTEEANAVSWDVILVNETWREEAEELVEPESGHIWMGSGGTKGKHGVGILLHRRWKNKITWKAVCSRVGALWMSVGSTKLAIIVVYMPHCGYPDPQVEAIYRKLDVAVKEARDAGRCIVIGGDLMRRRSLPGVILSVRLWADLKKPRAT